MPDTVESPLYGDSELDRMKETPND